MEPLGRCLTSRGAADLTLHEVNAAAEIIYEGVDPNANIIFGAVIDERMQGEVRITVIATGFNNRPGVQPQTSRYLTGWHRLNNVRPWICPR
jgi:cell division protein FtsZ